jgi:large subunit ribosomal protein L32e
VKMADKKLIEQRIKVKRRKPTYVRQDAHKKSKLGNAWRKPKGIQSKMRLNKRGYNKRPQVGYGSPKTVKGMTRRGLIPVNVKNQAEIASLDPAANEIIVANVGTRNKVNIVKKALEKNFEIMNIKDPKAFLDDVESRMKKKKTAKEEKKAEKEKKKKELEKVAKEKEKKDKEEKTIEESLSAEEKKEQEKKELDRTLTQRE